MFTSAINYQSQQQFVKIAAIKNGKTTGHFRDALGDLEAQLGLGLLQLCDPGLVGVAGGFAAGVHQHISKLPLDPLGLRIHLGQLEQNKALDESD